MTNLIAAYEQAVKDLKARKTLKDTRHNVAVAEVAAGYATANGAALVFQDVRGGNVTKAYFATYCERRIAELKAEDDAQVAPTQVKMPSRTMTKSRFCALLNADKEMAMTANLGWRAEGELQVVTFYLDDKELSTHPAKSLPFYTALNTYDAWLRQWRAAHRAVALEAAAATATAAAAAAAAAAPVKLDNVRLAYREVMGGGLESHVFPVGEAPADAKYSATVTAPENPFKETYTTAWVSKTHLKPETLERLYALRADDLPFWVHATEYGWIMRFDALEQYGALPDEPAFWLSQQPDVLAIGAKLKENGLQAAHLDTDGPVIDGLTEYEHG